MRSQSELAGYRRGRDRVGSRRRRSTPRRSSYAVSLRSRKGAQQSPTSRAMMPRRGVDRHRRGVTARRNRKVSPVNLQELLDKQDFYDAPAVVTGLSAARVRSVAARRAVRLSPDSCLRIASLTKVFTCTALVKTMRDNSIPLGTSVIELLPDLASDWRAACAPHRRADPQAGLGAARVCGLDGPCPSGRRTACAPRGGPARRGHTERTRTRDPLVLVQRQLHPGRCGPRRPQLLGYPRPRRPSGGLWSSVPDLPAVGEGLLADRALLNDIRRPRTTPDDPLVHGLGWALGPSGQMYLNGWLPGYPAASGTCRLPPCGLRGQPAARAAKSFTGRTASARGETGACASRTCAQLRSLRGPIRSSTVTTPQGRPRTTR